MLILSDEQYTAAQAHMRCMIEQGAPTADIEAVQDALIDYEIIRWPEDGYL